MNNAEIIANSCQRLASQWLDTLNGGKLILWSTVLGAVFLKLLVIYYLNKKTQLEYVSANNSGRESRLPKWLVELANHHQFPTKRIFIDTTKNDYQAFSAGLLQTFVVINQKVLQSSSRKQAEAVVLHELYHAKKLHNLKIALFNLLAEILFFLPIVKALADQFANHCEQTADQFVADQQKTNKYILESLKNALAYSLPNSLNTNLTLVTTAFGTANVENRITALKEKRFIINYPEKKLYFLTLITITFIGALSLSKQKIEASTQVSIDPTSPISSCNVWQCASKCLADHSLDKPAENQSKLELTSH